MATELSEFLLDGENGLEQFYQIVGTEPSTDDGEDDCGGRCGPSGDARDGAEATAAGLYFSDRGVRPLGRGGAFVAGADDLGAIWYNPAGIVDAPSSLLIDAAYLDYGTTYARQAQTTSATGTTFVQSFPPCTGRRRFYPFPPLPRRTALATRSSSPSPAASTRR